MKRTITLIAMFVCLMACGYGQQTVVYGGDFEHWKLNPLGYYDPDSSMFSTLNSLVTVGSGVTCFRCDTNHSGQYSAKVVTSEIASIPVIIPGVAGTFKINNATQNAILGLPYPYGTKLPDRFTGYYQSFPVLGDSSAVVVLLSKWNSGTHKRDTLAYNCLFFKGTVSSWTHFDTLITYRDHITIPDSLTILLLSCGGFNANQMIASKGRVGSTALFDDVNLTNVTGIPMLVEPEVSVKLSPNPASDILNISVIGNITNGTFEVIDNRGYRLTETSFSGKSTRVNVASLSNGVYLYRISENGKMINSGKFIVKK